MQSFPRRFSFPLWFPLAYALPATMLLLIATAAVAQSANDYQELPRFHEVNEQLYRGAQPRRGGIRRLVELGVNTVVNLRGPTARTRIDEADARALGLNYFNVPLPVWGRPDDDSVRRVLEILAAPGNGRVFVHCKDGVDRTGTIVALHRITRDGWLPDVATAEAKRYGMRRYQYWMRDYINDYYARRRAAGDQEGQPRDDDVEEGIKDLIGAGVRIGETAAFRIGKTAVRIARRTPRAVNGFLARVF
jgi:protein tyrosine phosphatase (PTP) superfamily phosphohydrolase (DUF442 family)